MNLRDQRQPPPLLTAAWLAIASVGGRAGLRPCSSLYRPATSWRPPSEPNWRFRYSGMLNGQRAGARISLNISGMCRSSAGRPARSFYHCQPKWIPNPTLVDIVIFRWWLAKVKKVEMVCGGVCRHHLSYVWLSYAAGASPGDLKFARLLSPLPLAALAVSFWTIPIVFFSW